MTRHADSTKIFDFKILLRIVRSMNSYSNYEEILPKILFYRRQVYLIAIEFYMIVYPNVRLAPSLFCSDQVIVIQFKILNHVPLTTP